MNVVIDLEKLPGLHELGLHLPRCSSRTPRIASRDINAVPPLGESSAGINVPRTCGASDCSSLKMEAVLVEARELFKIITTS